MAKKKSTLKDWSEVDTALRQIGELEINIETVQGEMNLLINKLKKETERKLAPKIKKKKELEKEVTAFCEGNKADFTESRSKVLTFGKVAYKVTTSIKVKAAAAAIKAMKALGLEDYLKVTEKLDKEKMLEIDDQTLARIGAERKVGDKLRIEPNFEKIRAEV